MRTMKRVAAVALSVVVLMTSGVSAKAAVTDVQPAKSSSEAVLKWKTKVGEEYDQVPVSLFNFTTFFVALFSK